MSIFYPRFGISAGNLGNQILQYMSLIGLSKKHNCDLQLPQWKYAKHFENPPTMYEPAYPPKSTTHIDEGKGHACVYTPEWFDQYATEFKEQPVSIFGWLQSFKYWQDYKDEVRDAMTFKEVFLRECRNKLPNEFYSRRSIGISIRQGDYRSNPNYKLLPVKYYIMALMEHFPDFRQRYNLMFFSDDIPYCKLHFECLPNAWFAEGMSDIQQLCLLSTMENMIIPNSTFGIAAAHIAELLLDPYNGLPGKIIRPSQYFDGVMNDERHPDYHSTTDLYPEHWIRFDIEQRINLKNVVFTIPVSYDSNDRKENLDLNLQLLLQDFDTNIIVGEQGPHKRFEYTKEMVQYHHFDKMTEFHRTKMLNDMTVMAKKPIVVNWDADVIVPPMQLIEAYRAIQEGNADMVYPYDGRFARVGRNAWYRRILDLSDIGVCGNTYFIGMGSGDYSVGGAIMWDTQAFVDSGMENENMISYAPEDTERYYRAKTLGYRIKRITGPLYHIDHVRGINSTVGHALYKDNARELTRLQNLSAEDLRKEVDAWPWKLNYNPAYHEGIVEEAVASRDEVFNVLFEWGVLRTDMTIVDVGCGLGAWGQGLRHGMVGDTFCLYYSGIDYKVPKKELLFDLDDYLDWDLRNYMDQQIASDYHADIVLCLECAEHIEEKYADQLVELLCRLGETILFSAAIPGQGGVNHVNEQWQAYWAEKFKERGYYPYYMDIRNKIWNNQKVSLWYRQNMILYCREFSEGTVPSRDVDYELDCIHPEMYLNILKSNKIL